MNTVSKLLEEVRKRKTSHIPYVMSIKAHFWTCGLFVMSWAYTEEQEARRELIPKHT